MPGRDTRTRWQGIYARHREGCTVEQLPRSPQLGEVSRTCDCEPSYYGKVYDRRARRHAVTKRNMTPAAARGARKELLDAIDKGKTGSKARIRLRDAHTRFINDAEGGRAFNKHGRPYKASAIKDVDECLRKHVAPRLGPRRLEDIRRGDIQGLIDDLAPRLSGSRVRSIVNAVRSLYRWAQDRELASEDPAAHVRLPAMEEKPRERVATPAEFAALLDALPIDDALPYALGGYAMGRRAQIQRLRWRDVDIELGLIEWGVEKDARKSRAARRVVPTVKPLLQMLRRAYKERGEPDAEHLVCPPLHKSKSGLLDTSGLSNRAITAWEVHGLQPIGLHDCRHTAATWLDTAGVSPKVASVLMGHSVPEQQRGAAPITLARYTHVLPDAIEKARAQLDAWLLTES